MLLKIIRHFVGLRKRPRRRGKSIFTYAILAMIVLLIVNRLPSALTKSNPILSLFLVVVIFVGLIWLGGILEKQIRQLPFGSIFKKWEDYCTQNPNSKQAAMTPIIGIAIYSPLLVIPLLLAHFNRELMIPFFCIIYAALGYCLEALTKKSILARLEKSRD